MRAPSLTLGFSESRGNDAHRYAPHNLALVEYSFRVSFVRLSVSPLLGSVKSRVGREFHRRYPILLREAQGTWLVLYSDSLARPAGRSRLHSPGQSRGLLQFQTGFDQWSMPRDMKGFSIF